MLNHLQTQQNCVNQHEEKQDYAARENHEARLGLHFLGQFLQNRRELRLSGRSGRLRSRRIGGRRFGDDRTVLLKRQGNIVHLPIVWHGADLMQTVGRVVNEAQTDNPAEICVDSIGLGAGVADRLREQGFNIRDVNVAEMSALNPVAAKLRDDLWIQVKDWLSKRSCRLPRSEELRADLVGPTYAFLSNGKLKV